MMQYPIQQGSICNQEKVFLHFSMLIKQLEITRDLQKDKMIINYFYDKFDMENKRLKACIGSDWSNIPFIHTFYSSN